MNKTLTLLAGAAALVTAAGLGYAASHKNHGAMVALDEVEWIPRPTSPVEVAGAGGRPGDRRACPSGQTAGGLRGARSRAYGRLSRREPDRTWKHTFLETGETRELPPGSYVFQPGGEMHGDACVGPEDCVLVLSQSVAADFILPE